MTPEEFRYLKAAMAALEDPEMSDMAQHKVLRTMSQICGKNADILENKIIYDVDAILDRRYQDLRNQKLVDLLKQ